MLIDWFTVTAQVINFLILVWLLKRFLYRPILDAIDAREKRIAEKIADANEKEVKAQKQHDEYQHKNEIFDQQRNAHMNEVLEAAKAERERLFDEARLESEDLRARLQLAIRNEQHSLSEELSRRAREEVFSIARKTLADLASTSLEQRMTEIFIDRLRELDTAQISELTSAFKNPGKSLRIRTAFKLSAQQKAEIETVMAEIFGKQKPLEFIVVSGLLSGIEINSDGRKIAWSISDYLDSLAKNVDELLRDISATKNTAPVNPTATELQDVDNNER